MINDEKAFSEGAKYFNKVFASLSNKRQYKEEYYLNTGLSMLRKRRKILIFTSCIRKTDYLFKVITEDVYDVVIYYFRTMVKIKDLESHYLNANVQFIKIRKNPHDEFSNQRYNHNTIVFAGDDTIIFDKKELGYEGSDYENNRKVYRDKSKKDYDLNLERANKLI